MRGWIIETDIYRLKKALVGTGDWEWEKLKRHLRRAEARLRTFQGEGVAG